MNINFELGKLGEPLTKLIEVVAKGIGVAYQPIATVKQAQADAMARAILARSDIDVAELRARTEGRLIYREQLRQYNIESVVSAATRELPESVSPEPVEVDWTLQFFDAAQDVCDEQMQTLWARILAGEVKTPGSYSKRTLQFLKTLDKAECEYFTELCSFAFKDNNDWHFLFDDTVLLTRLQHLRKVDYVGHFKGVGLLNPEPGMIAASACTDTEIDYFDKHYILKGPPKPKSEYGLFVPFEHHVFVRSFTQIGQQLAAICGAKSVPDYIDQLSTYHQKESSVSFLEHPRSSPSSIERG